jgi:acetyltransferase-like isoleucine patch superfamily enzyme
VVGRNAFIDAAVVIGRDCKIQDGALIYSPAVLADGVFVGPGAILTNDRLPRAVSPELAPVSREQWVANGVTVGRGASVGAGAVIVAGSRIGAWSMVGAGSVVVHDVPDHGLVVGNPARRIGWVGRSGVRLVADGNVLRCPATGVGYLEHDGELTEQPS